MRMVMGNLVRHNPRTQRYSGYSLVMQVCKCYVESLHPWPPQTAPQPPQKSASAEQHTVCERRPHRVQTLPGKLQKLKLVSGLMPRSGWAASKLVHAEASTPQHSATICA